jgi:hypothetical protein
LSLPDFTLGPKGFWNKIGTLLGQQHIEFQGRPNFSDNYLLRGSDPDAVRAIFNDRVLEYFEQNPGYNVEGYDDSLIIYQPAKRVSPTETASFLEDGLQILSLIHAG